MKTLGLRWDGLAGVSPAGGLLISRLKVRFLHGSPLDRGAATPPDSSFRSISCRPFQPRHQSVGRPDGQPDCSIRPRLPAGPSPRPSDRQSPGPPAKFHIASREAVASAPHYDVDFAGAQSTMGEDDRERGRGDRVDDDFAARGLANVGAWILGRNMFGPVRGA